MELFFLLGVVGDIFYGMTNPGQIILLLALMRRATSICPNRALLSFHRNKVYQYPSSHPRLSL